MTETLTVPEGATTEPTTQATTDARPSWLPEKFGSPEDMAKAYGELESKLGGGTAQAKPASTTGSYADLLAKAEAEVKSGGEVSTETYEALSKTGMTNKDVNEVLSARKSTVDNFTNTLIDLAGGQDGWTKLSAWAATTLDPADRTEFNASINSGDITRARFAMEAMVARHKAASEGPRAGLVVPDGSAQGHIGGYTSQAEVQNDMKDPRYKSDPAFRDAVMQRLAKSSL